VGQKNSLRYLEGREIKLRLLEAEKMRNKRRNEIWK